MKFFPAQQNGPRAVCSRRPDLAEVAELVLAMAEAKDKVVFVTKEEESDAGERYASDDSEAEEDERMGAVGPDGEIDWDCPCLQGMTTGPCGEPFKEAFACFVHSKAEPKGEDCLSEMKRMHDCIVAHPEHFSSDDESDSDVESESGDSESGKDAKAASGGDKSDGGDGAAKDTKDSEDAKTKGKA